MPAKRSAPPSFCDNLRASGLLSDAQLNELRTCPEAMDPAPTPLARVILQRGWLTRFQLNAVAAGRAGDLTIGPYVLLDRLGEGGMGMVYKARHQHMQRVVALKVIRKEKLGSPEAVRRFYQEVQMAAALSHPNIVLAYDAGPAGNTHYFAMEYVEGMDLARLVKEQGRLPWPQACDYVRQAALGLQHAHEKGLVHRDIKPANLLVSRAPAATEVSASPGTAPRGNVVKLLDMGLARLQGSGDKGMTRLGAVIGTPDFIAPEQALNSKAADIRADLYSLGCTLYVLLTGRPPFAGTEATEVLLQHQMEKPVPLAERGVEAPEGVQAILDRLMAKDPKDRYQTPAELVEDLTPFCREGTLASDGFRPLRDAARSEDAWASLTLDDAPEKSRSGRSQQGGRTAEWPRRGRKPGGKDGHPADEADRRKKRLWLLAAVGGGIGVLVLGLLGTALFWKSAPPPAGPVAQAPAPTPPGRSGPEPAPDAGKPAPPKGDSNPVPPPTPPAPAPGDAPGDAGSGMVLIPASQGVGAPIAFSPDSKRVAFGPSKIRVWDVEHKKQLHDCAGKKLDWASSLTWSSDGRQLLVGVIQGHLVLLDAETGEVLRNFTGHTTGVSAAAFCPDGRHIVTGAGGPVRRGDEIAKDADGKFLWEDSEVRRWELATGKEVARYRGPKGPVAVVRASADGQHIFAAPFPDAEDGVCFDWHVEKPDAPRRLSVPSSVRGRAISPDARELAVMGSDQVVRVCDLETGKELRNSGPLTDASVLVSWSGDGRYLLCGSGYVDEGNIRRKGPIRLLDAATCKEAKQFMGPKELVVTYALAPNGRHVLTWDFTDGIRLWDPDATANPDKPLPEPPSDKPISEGPVPDKPAPAAEKSPFTGHDGAVLSVAFSHDGTKLLSGGKDRTVRFWDVATGKNLKTLKRPVGAITLVGFAGKGSQAVGVAGDSGFTTWDLETEKVIYEVGTGQRSGWAISPDGASVILTQSDGFVTVQKTTDSGRRDHLFSGTTWGNPVASAFSADGHGLVFATSGDGLIHVADLVADKEVGKGFAVPRAEIICLAVAPKLTHVIVADEKDLTLWGLQTLKPVHHFEQYKEKVLCLAFSPDGKRVVTGAADSTVRVWEVATGKELKRSTEHKEAVRGVAFSPDGKTIASCGDAIKLWDWQTKPPAKP